MTTKEHFKSILILLSITLLVTVMITDFTPHFVINLDNNTVEKFSSWLFNHLL
ncbi:hypothetical protein [Flammeovirga pectinis]|uniref:hypothetical protein n=1 Tax=Flammeovirga pectinis TaxID=2494373 RepID=UPI0012D8047E|nr:hypothetical protein [Flammeovirga pectinis]